MGHGKWTRYGCDGLTGLLSDPEQCLFHSVCLGPGCTHSSRWRTPNRYQISGWGLSEVLDQSLEENRELSIFQSCEGADTAFYVKMCLQWPLNTLDHLTLMASHLFLASTAYRKGAHHRKLWGAFSKTFINFFLSQFKFLALKFYFSIAIHYILSFICSLCLNNYFLAKRFWIGVFSKDLTSMLLLIEPLVPQVKYHSLG